MNVAIKTRYNSEQTAGLLLFIGAAQFLTVMMLMEAVAPGYSMHDNAISDLGTIPETALIFNASLFAIGLINILAGLNLYKVLGDKALLAVFVLGGIGGMGAGLITLDSPLGVHGLFALLAFLFLNLEAIMVGLKLYRGLKFISIVAGIVGIIFLVLMVLVDSGALDLSGSIGHGGTERMIAYPALIWMVMFGGYLMAEPSLKRGVRSKR
jgi:hypothetical membrane protein